VRNKIRSAGVIAALAIGVLAAGSTGAMASSSPEPAVAEASDVGILWYYGPFGSFQEASAYCDWMRINYPGHAYYSVRYEQGSYWCVVE